MKVMMVNGSPHAKGNTFLALDEMGRVFEQDGIAVEMVHIGNKAIRGCIACGSCAAKKKSSRTARECRLCAPWRGIWYS